MVMIDMTNDCLIAWAPAHTNEHITSVAYVLRRPCCYRVRNLWFIAARKSPGLVCQELCNIAECKCRILTYTAATSDEYETTKSKIFHLLIPTMSLFVRSCRYKIGHALQNRWGWGGTCIRLFFFFLGVILDRKTNAAAENPLLDVAAVDWHTDFWDLSFSRRWLLRMLYCGIYARLYGVTSRKTVLRL